MKIKPIEVDNSSRFMESWFQNREVENILYNLILLQIDQDPDNWTPFTYLDYKEFCTHNVTPTERRVLDAFVAGGKPVWNTSAYLTPGWLSFENDQYSFTEKMIEALAENFKK